MKKYSLLLLLCGFFAASHAQNPGCDGIRYKSDVFTAVKKTTVPYGPTIDHLGASVTLEMDVYEPVGDVLTARPVVVLAHGGSFLFGMKTDLKAACERLAKRGYVVASIQYRLYPWLILGFPDSTKVADTATKAVGDMKAAVRYFREDASTTNQFKADADNIFIGGYSAGAVTALTASYLDAADNIPAFIQNLLNANGGLEGITGTTSNKTYSSSSKAVLNMSGGLYRSNWVDATDAPLVSIHGTSDATVNYDFGLAANIAYLEGSKRVHERATAANVWNHLVTVPGGGHTDIYEQVAYKPYLDSFYNKATELMEDITCAVLGTDQVLAADAWRIVPNPAVGGSLSVTLPQEMATANVEIWDVAGRLLLRREGVVSGEKIDVARLEPGTYWLGVRSSDGKYQGVKPWVR